MVFIVGEDEITDLRFFDIVLFFDFIFIEDVGWVCCLDLGINIGCIDFIIEFGWIWFLVELDFVL